MEKTKYNSKYEQYLELQGTGSELQARCPFHDDSVASLSINMNTGLWNCFACGASGNYEQFVSRIESNLPVVPDELVEAKHQLLILGGAPLDYLIKERGISRAIIDAFKIGFDGDRFWFPVKDETGAYVNVRRYKRNADAYKTIGYKTGYNKCRLYPISALSENPIYIMEGETDMLLARSIGLNAITQTGGAGTWSKEFSPLFTDKDVVITYDNDKAGRVGAEQLCQILSSYANSVKVINLPLSLDKEDFTDYIMKYKHTKEEFLELVDKAGDKVQERKEFLEKTATLLDNDIYETDLFHSSESKFYSKIVSIPVLVTGKDLSPYLIPKKIAVFCRMGQDKCKYCPIGQENGHCIVEFDEYSQEVLNMITASQANITGLVKKQLNVSCSNALRLDVMETFNIEDITVIADVDSFDFSTDSDYVARRIYYIGHGIKTNNTYKMIGRVFPDPRNQYATILVSEATPAQDSISMFRVEDCLQDLLLFKVKECE